ncbi:MAG: ferredoxin [Pseudomonadota bacterium]
MYIIVTSKPNEYSADLGTGVRAVETYDYFFYGKHLATHVIGEVVAGDARVRIVDAEYPDCVNSVPYKFFGDFDQVDEAREELQELTRFGDIDARLERVD